MKCPKCQSENIRVELRHKKTANIYLCTLGAIVGATIGGYSLAGFIGVIIYDTIAIFLMVIVSYIANSKMISTGICQNCGTIFDTKTKEIIQ